MTSLGMMLTNAELVAVIIGGAVIVAASLATIAVALVMMALDYRDDRRYQPRHDGTLTWPALLPPPRTPWDRPHPGWDVSPLTAGEIQVAAILLAVQRAELARAVPILQPSWVAQTMELCAREAGL